MATLNANAAILVVSVIISCAVCRSLSRAKCGHYIDLLTRGAGLGYMARPSTSLIYASFTFIFLCDRGVILATALEMCFGNPKDP